MKKSKGIKTRKLGCLVLGICCILPNAFAGGGTSYTIDNYLMSSGGGISSGGSYTIQGSIAQVTTGVSSGGVYNVSSGYWQQDTDLIFKNSFEQ